MAFDAKKNILLEKQYFYVKAQKGFKLQGTSTEVIPTNTGFYRFLVSNLTFALGNSYVDVLYDSTDMNFQAYCSDLFMENVQNTVTVAVENMNVDLDNFAKQNHGDITLVASKIDIVSEDLNSLTLGVSGGMQTINESIGNGNEIAHNDAVAIKDAVDNIDLSPVTAFKDANHQDLQAINEKIPSTSGLALDASSQSILAKLGDWLKEATFSDFVAVLSTALQLLHTDNSSLKDSVDVLGKDSTLQTIDSDIKAVPSTLAKDSTVSDFATGVGGALQAINTILEAISTSNAELPTFKSANHSDLSSILAKIPSTSGLALDATLSALATALGTALQAVNTNLEAISTSNAEIPNLRATNHSDLVNIKAGTDNIAGFKSANHTDLTALLTAFNSLADELKKKLANKLSLDVTAVYDSLSKSVVNNNKSSFSFTVSIPSIDVGAFVRVPLNLVGRQGKGTSLDESSEIQVLLPSDVGRYYVDTSDVILFVDNMSDSDVIYSRRDGVFDSGVYILSAQKGANVERTTDYSAVGFSFLGSVKIQRVS